ncbi:MAG: hypothetical protein ACJ8HU_01470 [Chthoniobacterales bacterium]
MTTLPVPANIAPKLSSDFWVRLLQDESMKALSDLERLVTGCEIIAALDDLELSPEFAN